jgi:hypothetical protein
MSYFTDVWRKTFFTYNWSSLIKYIFFYIFLIPILILRWWDNHQLKRKSKWKCFCAIKTLQFFWRKNDRYSLVLAVFTTYFSFEYFNRVIFCHACFVINGCVNTWAGMNFGVQIICTYLILTLFLKNLRKKS